MSTPRLLAAVTLWCAGVLLAGVVLAVGLSAPEAFGGLPMGPAKDTGNAKLQEVVNHLRDVIVSLLVALATLFATIGGVRYLLAGGDPGEAEAGKRTLRQAAFGYGIAALAPVLVQVLKYVVGA